MPVFLSHKREDKPETLEIANYLKRHGIPCYVDVFDPILQSTDDITSILMKRVKQCTHLMAVVSGNTQKSWWVPFEIGVASELERRITSFELSKTDIPDFLGKWPIIKNQKELDLFIKFYKKDKSIALEESHVFDSASPSPVDSADKFHRELKASISANRTRF